VFTNNLASRLALAAAFSLCGFPAPLRAVESEKPPPFQPTAVPTAPTPAPPKHAGVRVRFDGATKFSEKQLREAIAEQIAEINESGLTAAAADDAAFFLGIFYRKNGYPQAEVKSQVAAGDTLVLKISEGPLTLIGDVTFRGNKTFPDATLRDYVVGATRERFSLLKKQIPFVEADVKTGVERVQGLYQSEGFLDVVVDPAQITFSPDHTRASVSVALQEGRRYTFGKPAFSGDLMFFGSTKKTQEPQGELLKQLEPFLKKPYTHFQVTNMQRAVIYFYKQRGYFDPKVTVESDPANATKDGVVPIEFHIESGGFYRFDGMEVSGLDRLRHSFLEHRFGKLSGKFYNPDKLDEVFSDLMRTGLFKTLRVEPEALPDSTVKLNIQAEETKSKELGASIGYGTFEGAILGLHAAERDLFGTGRPVTADLEFSQRLLKGEVTLSDPWFLESDYAMRVRLYGLTQDFDGYSKSESGGRIELSRKLTKNFEAAAFVLSRVVSIQDNGIEPQDIGPASYTANSIGMSETLDFRNSAVNPGRGWVIDATESFSASVLGSSLDFLRGTGRISYYWPIKKTLLALGARAGVLVPLSGNDSIPIDERFFNGGSRSVRSFAERDLGPKDIHDFPIGGDTFSTFNVEYVFPIWGDLDGALFVDAGSVGARTSDGLGTMRYGVGGGLRYRLPVGPLRLDYGFNPDRRANEDTGAFHFSFGVAF
jgi:outer membrane protein insertion porin family